MPLFNPAHIGVPTREDKPGAAWAEGMKIFITSPDDHPFGYEFVKFEPGNPFHEKIRNNLHVAGYVDSIDEVLGQVDEVLLPKTDAGDIYMCFVEKDGVVLELMEKK